MLQSGTVSLRYFNQKSSAKDQGSHDKPVPLHHFYQISAEKDHRW